MNDIKKWKIECTLDLLKSLAAFEFCLLNSDGLNLNSTAFPNSYASFKKTAVARKIFKAM